VVSTAGGDGGVRGCFGAGGARREQLQYHIKRWNDLVLPGRRKSHVQGSKSVLLSRRKREDSRGGTSTQSFLDVRGRNSQGDIQWRPGVWI